MVMQIFEFRIPGTWLDYQDHNWCHKINILLHQLESCFYEANTALNLFNSSRPDIKAWDRDQWDTDNERRRNIRDEVERQLGDDWAMREAVNLETEVRFKHEQWASGRPPQALEQNKPFLYARMFLYALDGFDKFLSVLSSEAKVPKKLAQLSEGVAIAFPHLRMVRNSAQHLEDRMRGLGAGRNPKPLTLKPVRNEAFEAPNGALILNSLNGSKYGNTMADGHYGEVDVSAESMQKLQKILCEVYECFKWKGSPRHCPS